MELPPGQEVRRAFVRLLWAELERVYRFWTRDSSVRLKNGFVQNDSRIEMEDCGT
jgi:hypothetical protein